MAKRKNENNKKQTDKRRKEGSIEENKIQIDELNDEKIEILTENWRLVSLISQGLSVKKAKSRVKSNQSERSIRNLVKKYKTDGQEGLTDRR